MYASWPLAQPALQTRIGSSGALGRQQAGEHLLAQVLPRRGVAEELRDVDQQRLEQLPYSSGVDLEVVEVVAERRAADRLHAAPEAALQARALVAREVDPAGALEELQQRLERRIVVIRRPRVAQVEAGAAGRCAGSADGRGARLGLARAVPEAVLRARLVAPSGGRSAAAARRAPRAPQRPPQRGLDGAALGVDHRVLGVGVADAAAVADELALAQLPQRAAALGAGEARGGAVRGADAGSTRADGPAWA